MKKIWIDAGHGGTASGATFEKRMEKDDALRFALELERQFLAQGCKTVMTRRTNVDVSPEARTKMERDNNCDLAISCHRNAANISARGLEAWVQSAAIVSIEEWAMYTVQAVSEASGMPRRAGTAAIGVYKGYRDNPRADYFVNRETNSPSMLLELGFITNKEDNAAFDANLADMCAAVVREACRFLGVLYKEPNGTNDSTTPVVPESPNFEALYNEAHEKQLVWQKKAENATTLLDKIRQLIG